MESRRREEIDRAMRYVTYSLPVGDANMAQNASSRMNESHLLEVERSPMGSRSKAQRQRRTIGHGNASYDGRHPTPT